MCALVVYVLYTQNKLETAQGGGGGDSCELGIHACVCVREKELADDFTGIKESVCVR